MEEPHTSVLREAFVNIKRQDGNKVIISAENQREFILNRDLLVLFSGFFRDLLSSVPQCPSYPVTTRLIIPELSSRVVPLLQDILTLGQCADLSPLPLEDSEELLEACQLLGLDIQKIHYERLGTEQAEQDEVRVDLATSNSLRQSWEQKKKEGKRIVFESSAVNSLRKRLEQEKNKRETVVTGSSTVNNKGSPESPESPGEDQTNPSSGVPLVPSIEIKKEVEMETESVGEDSAMETVKSNSDPGQASAPTAEKEEKFNKTNSVTSSIPSAADSQSKSRDSHSKYECEQCKKPQSNLLNLKRHLVCHFLEALKKNNGQFYDKGMCILCAKSITNLQTFLVHVGIHHDKINDVLKMKGMKELPPHFGKPTPREQSSSSKKSTPKTLSNIQKVEKASKKVNSPATSMSTSTSSSPLAPPGPPPQTPGRPTSAPLVPPTPASERKPLDSECNFNLSCQVCTQRLGNLHQLEQHLCRHFMKELQDSYSDLMNDMKCTLCHNVFKHKHSLILHLGCKHGKINDILRQKNLKVLPAPILNNSSKVMQNKLKQVEKEVKREKEDSKEASNSGETLNEATAVNDNGQVSTKYSSEVKDILKKCKIPY